MVEQKTTIGTAIVALLISIAGFGGNMYLTDDQFQNSYYCDLTQTVGIFAGGLSGSGERGYPNVDNRKGYKDCTNGNDRKPWIPLKDYAESQGVDPMQFILSNGAGNGKTAVWGESYTCNQSGCVLKENN